MARDEAHVTKIGADAAAAATEDAAAAIERAAERNDDPAVAESLDEAAIHADSAVVRVGWLRSMIRRLFARA